MVVEEIPEGTVILLVEDDDAIREALTDVLADQGYVVQSAENGARALDLLLAGLRPQVILLDLMMPVMDGWQLLERLVAADELQQIPVVTVSAARAPCPKGACQSLRKPLDVEDLLGAVERHRQPDGPPDAACLPERSSPHRRPFDARI